MANGKLRGLPFTDGDRSPKAWIIRKLQNRHDTARPFERHVRPDAVIARSDSVTLRLPCDATSHSRGSPKREITLGSGTWFGEFPM